LSTGSFKSVVSKSWLGLAVLGALVGCTHHAGSTSQPAAKVAPVPATVDALPAQGFSRDWSTNVPLDGSKATEIHLRDDLVFVYSADHKSYLIDRASGQLLSIMPVTSPRTTLRPPVVLGDKIVYPTNSTLEVYNRKGRLLKSLNLGFAIRSDATGVAPNTIYVGSDYGNGGRLSAVNLNKDYGFLFWELNTFGGVSSKPVVVQTVVYVGGEDGRVYAVNPDRGGAWGLPGSAFASDGPIYGNLAGDDYGIFAASFDGKLYCLDRSNGKIKWMWYAQAPLKDTPVVTATLVYQRTSDGSLVAIDKTTGEHARKPKWTAPGVKQVLSEDEKHTYVLTDAGEIAALDKATGAQLFTNSRRDFVSFATNTKSATIYGVTAAGQVIAIKPILRAGLTGELVFEPVGLRDAVAMK